MEFKPCSYMPPTKEKERKTHKIKLNVENRFCSGVSVNKVPGMKVCRPKSSIHTKARCMYVAPVLRKWGVRGR